MTTTLDPPACSAGDTPDNLLWRLRNGELPSPNKAPAAVFVMIGTNELDFGRTDEGPQEESNNLAEFILSRHAARADFIAYVMNVHPLWRRLLPSSLITTACPTSCRTVVSPRLCPQRAGRHSCAQVLPHRPALVLRSCGTGTDLIAAQPLLPRRVRNKATVWWESHLVNVGAVLGTMGI